MTKLGYFNKGEKLVVATIEDKDVERVIGSIVFEMIEKEIIDPDGIRNKHFFINDEGKVETTEIEIPVPDGKTPAHAFVALLEQDEEGFIFDECSVYSVKNEYFTELDKEAFEVKTCPTCGAVYFKKDMIGKLCIDCYVREEIPKQLKAETNEFYTEFEQDSLADEVVSKLVSYTKEYANGLKALIAGKDKIENYLEKKNVSSKTRKRLMGLFI